jgi:oligopeptide/dipeptide ABC transporter ATP-binding protein
MPEEVPLLRVQGLSVRYRGRGRRAGRGRAEAREIRAVDDISLTVWKGEMIALVGESGSGKTSTAHAILRLVAASAGEIWLGREKITALSPRQLRPLRRQIQMVYQDPYEALDPRFTVEETVEEPLLVHRVESSRETRRRRVLESLVKVGLTPPAAYAARYPHELSGGQRQRVAIAASLVLAPELLIADEPVSMLDVSVRAGILGLLDELRTAGMGILMITHDLSTAAHFADRIAVMYLGRIVEEGTAADVVRNPQHPYTRALIAAVPRVDPGARLDTEMLRGETPDLGGIPSGCRFHPRCPVALDECAHIDIQLRTVDGHGSLHRAACVHVTG